MNTSALISNFVSEERNRFSEARNNFAMCFGQIVRYCGFLQIILNHYEEAGRSVVENTKLMMEFGKTGRSGWGEEKRKELDRGYQLQFELHFQIESFYIFAKILLDKVAQGIYFYFGNSQTSFQSHHTMITNINRYVDERKLTPIPNSLVERMGNLQETISDFRDDVIVHQYAPRAMKATMFDNTTGETWLSDNRVHPKPGEKQRDSLPPKQLIKLVDTYIEAVFEYLMANKNKAAID